MLQPAQKKFKKEFRVDRSGTDYRGSDVSYGDFGLQATGRCWLTAREIESARKAIVNYTNRKGKLWVKVFPSMPYTKKPAEVRRGSGKGPVDHYYAVVKPGRVLFEVGGVSEVIATRSLELASAKLSVKTRIIKKAD